MQNPWVWGAVIQCTIVIFVDSGFHGILGGLCTAFLTTSHFRFFKMHKGYPDLSSNCQVNQAVLRSWSTETSLAVGTFRKYCLKSSLSNDDFS